MTKTGNQPSRRGRGVSKGSMLSVLSVLMFATGLHAGTRIAGVDSSSRYVQYYGSDFSTSNLQLLASFDVVVLHPDAANVTPATVAYLQSNGVKYVLGYISIGEQMPGTPVIRGNGEGPVYCTTNGTSTVTYESNNVASFYVDQAWSNSISAYVIRNNGQVDRNGTFGGPYVWPNADWRWVLNTQRIGGVPGTSLSNMFVAGLAQIAGSRVSNSDTVRTNNFGFDGFFLDTLDTAGPFAGLGSYPWAAQEMQNTVKFIHDTYTNKVVFANRGVFFYNPLLVNPQFNIRPYTYSIRPYVHATLFESYLLDSSPCDTILNPYVNDNKYDYARKMNAEANRPDGFTMFCLDYQMNRGTNLYEMAMNESVSSNGWVEYLCPDGSLATIGTYALNHPRAADNSPPVWDSTANAGIAGGDLSCPNANTLSPNPTPPRVGIQSIAAGNVLGDVVIRWDVAMDQTPPVKYNIYQSSSQSFAAYTAYSNVVFQIGDGWSIDPTTYSANQYTLHSLPAGTYYFRVRAQDSSLTPHEDTNTVTLSITLANTRYNAILTGNVTVNGDLLDWTPLKSFGLQSPDFPTTSTNPVDLAQLWIAHDGTNFYFAYQNNGPTTNGLNAAYELYFDTDTNRATGFRGGTDNFPVGADYLLQGNALYRYTGSTGTDWSWSLVGLASSAVASSNVELTLPRMWFGNPSRLNLFFLSDNSALPGGTLQGQYPNGALHSGGSGAYLTYTLPDAANPIAAGSIAIDGNLADWTRLRSFGADLQETVISATNRIDIAQLWAAHDATNFYFACQNYGPIASNDLNWAYNLYIDTDRNRATGFRGGGNDFPVGADYLLQGATLYQYAGTTGTDWNWIVVGIATWAAGGSNVEYSVPRSWFGNASLLRLFFYGDNSAYGGSTLDLYPDGALAAGGGGDYLAYRITDVSNPVGTGSIAVNGNLSDWTSLLSFGVQSPGLTPTGSNPADLTQLWVANDTSNLFLAYQNYGPTTSGLNGAYNLYIDTDANRSSGFRGGTDNFPIGAEYLLQGSSLYQYSGAGTDWNWTLIGSAASAVASSNAELSLPRVWLGNPELLELFFLDDNPSIGGTIPDVYPRSALQSRGGGVWLTYRVTITNPNADSVGDGIPDWWRAQYFPPGNGSTTNNPGSCAICDPDGDGLSNLQEFLTGTNPTNSASAFRIISVARTGSNIRVTWQCGASRTNIVQSTATLTGSYTNLSSNIVVTGSGDVVTNYLDVGVATNQPTRYYRVHLVP